MSDTQYTQEPGPKPIRRLTESLVNRIAAGEIIHRPSSALKELLENSLDAGATSIRITVKDGGLKLLQIQDNGSGIRKSDLAILAERFTTSKLTTFEDLQRIRTYGFRGEALASISHVAHLSVTTKTKDDSCAWKAQYLDGELAPAKPGQSADPKPTAGNDGTTITVENLFYNTPTRLAAIRSSSEEYSRILDVVTKYAVHNPTVSFSCKKAGSASPDISTPSNSTVKQTIRLLYGNTVARDLISASISPFQNEDETADGEDIVMDSEEGREGSWSAEAHFSNVNYHAKKTVFLLFINHRLVESSRMKRALESVFTVILPKGAFPFIYLSLEIDPQAVDVNVHPTKREVHFLDEELITSAICDRIQALLADQGNSRVFEYQTQTLLTGGILEPSSTQRKGKGKEKEVASTSNSQDDDESNTHNAEESQSQSQEDSQNRKKPVYSKDKVRVSQANRTLDSMFPVAGPSSTPPQAATHPEPIDVDDEENGEKDKYRGGVNVNPEQQVSVDGNRVKYIRESQCFLKTVRELREDVLNARHEMLTEIIQNHVFVGVVDLKRSLSLIQHETKLYLVNHAALAEELFYQLGLRQFGDFARIRLNPPPDVRRLVGLAVQAEQSRWLAHGFEYKSDVIVEKILAKIIDRVTLLEEYFSMKIVPASPDEPSPPLLESIPLLLKGYTPDLTRLPLFLMRLGPQVNWSSEKECLRDFLRELAYFYAPYPLNLKPGADGKLVEENTEAKEKAEKWTIEHVLLACMRKNLVPPRTLLERDVVQVASLPDLYRVFERC